MVLYVSETPEQAQQSQLARVSAERLQNVINALGDRINAGGLRQEAFQEAQRFADILADTSMSLSERSLDLWASLISLGNISESNHQAGLAGRDPLDLLPLEAKSALSTFMAIAGNLVRSFNHIKEMDDGHASFSRTQITPELVLALLDRALSARFVDERSAGLVQHVAKEAHETGKQSEKALSATQSGGFNLLKAASAVVTLGLGGAAVAVGGVVDGVVDGITSDIGTDISDHYELGEKAIQFLESSESQIQAYIDVLPADQAAQLRHEVQTTLDQKKGPR